MLGAECTRDGQADGTVSLSSTLSSFMQSSTSGLTTPETTTDPEDERGAREEGARDDRSRATTRFHLNRTTQARAAGSTAAVRVQQ